MSQEKNITQKFLCKKEDHLPRYFTLQQLEAMDSGSDGYSYDGWVISEEPKIPAEIADNEPGLINESETSGTSSEETEVNHILGIPAEKPKKASKPKKPATEIEEIEKYETIEDDGVEDVTKTDTDNATDRKEQEGGERDNIGSERQEVENPA